ncbi:PLP-dependent transferase [Mycena belliarum]|uniref:PLP-dependent transferase n=1 Tax=Mycena belliarum TaxID=1033014 RepID=A0AAD6TNY2_9AGAR|nr:PLP-dependent transferase [Mycena belliae]
MSDLPPLPLSTHALKRLAFPPPHAYSPPDGPFFDPELYPEGPINISIAENSLLSDRLLEHFAQPLTELRSQHLRYRATLIKTDLPTVEDLLPAYINDHFHPRVKVTRENSVTGPGVGALLAQVVWALAGEGQGVLMSAPFYDDYVRDIRHPALSALVVADAPCDVDTLSSNVLPYLESKILESKRAGVKIKVMLIPNPHNPLGRVVGKDVIEGYACIAQKHNIHLIVDEVYGLSTFSSAYPPEINVPFASVLTYDLEALGVEPARVHVLAGPTKDFGASGLKLGLFISPSNPALVALLRPLFFATPISSASDALFARLLSDKPFVEKFLQDNSKALGRAYELVAGWCIWHGLEFTRANAAVYIVVDFAPFLARLPRSPVSEEDLDDPDSPYPFAILDAAVAALCKAGVYFKPTNLMGDPVRTRFRVVFSQPRATMELALRRIEKAFRVPEAPLAPPQDSLSSVNLKRSGNGSKVISNGPTGLEEKTSA